MLVRRGNAQRAAARDAPRCQCASGLLRSRLVINIHAVNHPAAPVNARLLVGYPVLVL